MRTVLVTLIVTLAFAAHATEGTARPKRERSREDHAKVEVRKTVRPWMPKGARLQVRTALVGFNGSERNPITGLGPIAVFAKQISKDPPGRLARLNRDIRDRFANRLFIVDVDRNGKAHILEQYSLSTTHRALRLLGSYLPVSEMASYALHSKEAQAGLMSLIGAWGVSDTSGLGAGAMLTTAAKFGIDGFVARKKARADAFDATVKWATEQSQTPAGWPTLVEAYRHYQVTLERTSTGTTCISILEFAKRLAAENL
jgi:hypothetical protein